MSCQTKIYMKGQITADEIVEFLAMNDDVVNVTKDIIPIEIELTDVLKVHIDTPLHGNRLFTENGEITVFLKNGYSRKLFYNYSNYHFPETAKVCFGEEKKIASTDKTFLSVATDQIAFDILSSIVNHFGGWICANDEKFLCKEVIAK